MSKNIIAGRSGRSTHHIVACKSDIETSQVIQDVFFDVDNSIVADCHSAVKQEEADLSPFNQQTTSLPDEPRSEDSGAAHLIFATGKLCVSCGRIIHRGNCDNCANRSLGDSPPTQHESYRGYLATNKNRLISLALDLAFDAAIADCPDAGLIRPNGGIVIDQWTYLETEDSSNRKRFGYIISAKDGKSPKATIYTFRAGKYPRQSWSSSPGWDDYRGKQPIRKPAPARKITTKKDNSERERKARNIQWIEQAITRSASRPVHHHPYLAKKGLTVETVKKWGGHLIKWFNKPAIALPMKTPDGATKGYQLILSEPYNGNNKTTFTLESDNPDPLYLQVTEPNHNLIIVAEGWATAEALRRAMKTTVVCSFGTGRMKRTVEALRAANPNAHIVMALDEGLNDPAMFRLRKVAGAAGAIIALPASGNGRNGLDFDDLAREEGLKAVRRKLAEALLPNEIYRHIEMQDIDPHVFSTPYVNQHEAFMQARQIGQFHGLMSETGTGKTTAANKLIEDDSACYVAPRQRLAESMGEKMGLTVYNEADFDPTIGNHRLSICYNSLVNDKFDSTIDHETLIIDESELIYAHATMGTVRFREQVYHNLQQRARRSGLTLWADAHLSHISMAEMRKVAGDQPCHVWFNLHQSKRGRTVQFWEAKGDLHREIEQAFKASQRVYIATGSVMQGKVYAERAKKLAPEGYRVLNLNAETARSEAGQAFFNAKEVWRVVQDYDCIIMSPVGGTGIDINVPDLNSLDTLLPGGTATKYLEYFDRHFGYFGPQLTADEIVQNLSRCRQAVCWDIFCPNIGKHSLQIEADREINLQKDMLKDMEIRKQAGQPSIERWSEQFMKLYRLVWNEQNADRAKLLINLEHRLHAQGYAIPEMKRETDHAYEFARRNSAYRKQIAEDQALAIEEVDDMFDFELRTFETDTGFKTADDFNRRVRRRVQNGLRKINVTADEVGFWHNYGSSIRDLEDVLDGDLAFERDMQEYRTGVSIVDRTHRVQRRELARQMLAAGGLDPDRPESWAQMGWTSSDVEINDLEEFREFRQADLAGFAQFLEGNEWEINRRFDNSLLGDSVDVVQRWNSLLKKYGFETKNSQISADKILTSWADQIVAGDGLTERQQEVRKILIALHGDSIKAQHVNNFNRTIDQITAFADLRESSWLTDPHKPIDIDLKTASKKLRKAGLKITSKYRTGEQGEKFRYAIEINPTSWEQMNELLAGWRDIGSPVLKISKCRVYQLTAERHREILKLVKRRKLFKVKTQNDDQLVLAERVTKVDNPLNMNDPTLVESSGHLTIVDENWNIDGFLVGRIYKTETQGEFEDGLVDAWANVGLDQHGNIIDFDYQWDFEEQVMKECV